MHCTVPVSYTHLDVYKRQVLDRYNHTLEELNLLVYKLAQMTEKQIEVYEGVLKALPERNMKQVINGLYNLERFEFLPGIQCDNEIGEMTIDNDLDPICLLYTSRCV